MEIEKMTGTDSLPVFTVGISKPFQETQTMMNTWIVIPTHYFRRLKRLMTITDFGKTKGEY
jgi:hypothetical protein